MAIEKSLKFLNILMDHSKSLKLNDFKCDEWGSDDAFRRFYQNVNDTWVRLTDHQLFTVEGKVNRGKNYCDKREFVICDQNVKKCRDENITFAPALVQFLPAFKGTKLEEKILTPLQRKKHNLGNKFLKNLEKKFYSFNKGIVDYQKYSDILENIYTALMVECKVKVTRYSSTQKAKVEEKLVPLNLTLFNQQFYLIAKQNNNAEIRKYRIDNFSALKLTEERFTYPCDFEPADHFTANFGFVKSSKSFEVKLQIQNGWALDYVKTRKWTTSDKYFDFHEYSIFCFVASDYDETLNFVLGLKDQVVVLSPVELREKICDVLDGMRQLYLRDAA